GAYFLSHELLLAVLTPRLSPKAPAATSRVGGRLTACFLEALHLEEVEPHRRLAAEEGHHHLDLALLQVDLVHQADKVHERTIDDADALTLDEADTDARLLRLHLTQDALDLAFVQRDGAHAGADEAGDAGRVAHDKPGAARFRVVLLQRAHVD